MLTSEEYYNDAFFNLKNYVITKFALRDDEITGTNIEQVISMLAGAITLKVKSDGHPSESQRERTAETLLS